MTESPISQSVFGTVINIARRKPNIKKSSKGANDRFVRVLGLTKKVLEKPRKFHENFGYSMSCLVWWFQYKSVFHIIRILSFFSFCLSFFMFVCMWPLYIGDGSSDFLHLALKLNRYESTDFDEKPESSVLIVRSKRLYQFTGQSILSTKCDE